MCEETLPPIVPAPLAAWDVVPPREQGCAIPAAWDWRLFDVPGHLHRFRAWHSIIDGRCVGGGEAIKIGYCWLVWSEPVARDSLVVVWSERGMAAAALVHIGRVQRVHWPASGPQWSPRDESESIYWRLTAIKTAELAVATLAPRGQNQGEPEVWLRRQLDALGETGGV
jgi:hypothetical protein